MRGMRSPPVKSGTPLEISNLDQLILIIIEFRSAMADKQKEQEPRTPEVEADDDGAEFDAHRSAAEVTESGLPVDLEQLESRNSDEFEAMGEVSRAICDLEIAPTVAEAEFDVRAGAKFSASASLFTAPAGFSAPALVKNHVEVQPHRRKKTTTEFDRLKPSPANSTRAFFRTRRGPEDKCA